MLSSEVPDYLRRENDSLKPEAAEVADEDCPRNEYTSEALK
jgi:hypothetical protein